MCGDRDSTRGWVIALAGVAPARASEASGSKIGVN